MPVSSAEAKRSREQTNQTTIGNDNQNSNDLAGSGCGVWPESKKAAVSAAAGGERGLVPGGLQVFGSQHIYFSALFGVVTDSPHPPHFSRNARALARPVRRAGRMCTPRLRLRSSSSLLPPAEWIALAVALSRLNKATICMSQSRSDSKVDLIINNLAFFMLY